MALFYINLDANFKQLLTMLETSQTLSDIINWQDWVVIAAYFVVIGAIAWWTGRNQKSTADYFLAGRNVGWLAIGASIFTANIGSEHIVGLAGAGANSGMAMAHMEMHAWVLIVLAYVFVPFYYKAGVYTIPEFLEKRFGSKLGGSCR